MQLTSNSFSDGERIPAHYALARAADPGPVELSANCNPHLSWSHVPDGTRSFVITCIDPDAPTVADDVNQPDREVPSTLPRADFTHWLLVDVPSDVREIAEGSHCSSVTAGGKPAGSSPVGNHGINDYTAWFSGDPDMGGVWHGYDGPAPPWNDSIPHRYVFTVYAVDVESLGLGTGFTRDDLTAALDGHILDSASITGTYVTNKRLLS